eukprot:6436-Heterococcus_DN1.PRE.13
MSVFTTNAYHYTAARKLSAAAPQPTVTPVIAHRLLHATCMLACISGSARARMLAMALASRTAAASLTARATAANSSRSKPSSPPSSLSSAAVLAAGYADSVAVQAVAFAPTTSSVIVRLDSDIYEACSTAKMYVVIEPIKCSHEETSVATADTGLQCTTAAPSAAAATAAAAPRQL